MAVLSKPILKSLFKSPHTLHEKHRRPLLLALFVLLLLRSRAVTLGRDALSTLRQRAEKLTKSLQLKLQRKLTPEELSKVLQQVYLDGPDGSKVILALYRDRVVKVPIHPTPQSRFDQDKSHFPPLSRQTLQKPNIDLAFLHQLRAILFRIAIPSWRSSEAGIVVLHSSFLVLRTVLSILVARLDGRIVRDLVRADGKGFLKGLGLWFLLAVPSTFTNSMIRHFQSLLANRLRTRLTRYLHDLYLSSYPDLRYYRAPNYLEGMDQYLTADVEAWSNALSGLYGNVLKPSLDLLLFTSQLSRSLGIRGTILLFANYYTTVRILRWASPAFGSLAATEARLEGEYRAGVGRVGREAEEVAFYDGGGRERKVLEGLYRRLVRHVNLVYKIRIKYEWTEDYVIKYLWSAAGYALIAVPILYTRTKRSLGLQSSVPGSSNRGERDRTDEAVAGRTETYISNRRLLLSLADAGGRLMYAYKDLLELAGLTTRLYTLLTTLLHMPPQQGRLEVDAEMEEGEVVLLRGVDVRVPKRRRLDAPRGSVDSEGGKKKGKGRLRLQEPEPSSAQTAAARDKHNDVEKEEREDTHTLDPPLVKNLSLIIKRGEHLMITGSNGVGKTAVARVLAGLWEPDASSAGSSASGDEEEEGRRGYVRMPRDETEADVLVRRVLYERERQRKRMDGHFSSGNGRLTAEYNPEEHEEAETQAQADQDPHWRPRPTLYVVPQRSYMTSGSLLEQVIYPCSYAQFIRLTSSFAPGSGSSMDGVGSSAPTPAPTPAPVPPPLSRTASISNLFAQSLPSLSSLPSLPALPSFRSRNPNAIQDPLPSAIAEILTILEKVHLGYLVEREGGLGVRKEWRDVLSGGEKQRMAMARVLWWRPRWAVLDECTSAVSSDVEGRMYEAAKAMDITLITISLRPSLMKYHTQLLTLRGPSSSDPVASGKWTLSRIGTPEERMSIQKEIKVLEEKLREVEGWEKRVSELEGLLGVQELDEGNELGAEGVFGASRREGSKEDEELERKLLARGAASNEEQEEDALPKPMVKAEDTYTANGDRHGSLLDDDGLEDAMDAQEMEVEAEIEAEAVGGESLA